MNEEARFRSELAQSWEAVFAVARYIHGLGEWEIHIGPYRVRPSYEQRDGYGDEQDLAVRKFGAWRRIEVKWRRSLEFTCRDDFPFPVVFVDRAPKAEKGVPDSYFICNHALTHAAIIHSSTREHWIKRYCHDPTKGYGGDVYECSIAHAKFVSLGGLT